MYFHCLLVMEARKFILLFCIALKVSQGKVHLDGEKKKNIDNFINSLLFDCAKHKISGMNLAIVFKGETLYTPGYGLRDIGKNFKYKCLVKRSENITRLFE